MDGNVRGERTSRFLTPPARSAFSRCSDCPGFPSTSRIFASPATLVKPKPRLFSLTESRAVSITTSYW